jgi:DNA invertase Pin-like site-specific DNA recombinase
MAVFGYARVSSQDQDLAAQVGELMAAGAAKVYREKVSGAKANRAELLKVVNKLEPGTSCWSAGSIGWRGRRGTC